MQTHWTYCRLLMETSLSFPVTPYPSENSPIQSQAFSYTKITPYWPTIFPLPTSTPANNINTRSQPENLQLFQHPNHTLIHLEVHHKFYQLLNFTGTPLIILKPRNKPTYWLSFPSCHHYTGRGWNIHSPISTRPPPWYKFLGYSWQFIHQHNSLHQCHNNTFFGSLWTYTPIPRLWLGPQYLHAPTVGSKMVNLIQCQSTASHPIQMRVYGGSNFCAFGFKHLFYLLFVGPTYVHVSGGSTFSDSVVGLVPVLFTGSLTLH